ncbi:MAG: PKD domain-containing protein, partial [Chloroflexota bacterium]
MISKRAYLLTCALCLSVFILSGAAPAPFVFSAPAALAVNAGPDLEGGVGEAITFKGSYSGEAAGSPALVYWNFGDESGLTRSLTAQHTYTKPGTYNAVLLVRDAQGALAYDYITVTIHASSANPLSGGGLRQPRAPGPLVNAGPDQSVAEGATVNFNGIYTTSNPVSLVFWTFGDESSYTETPPATPTTPTHVYSDNGLYQVMLLVMDTGGISTDYLYVTVNNAAPVVNPFPGATINEGSTYISSGTFSDSGAADTFPNAVVDYGDGTGSQSLTLTGNTFNLSHTYADNGSFT